MSGSFDPGEFTDEYRVALTALLDAKQSGGEVVQPEEVEEPGAAVVDLMSALRRSVEKARGGSAESADDEGTPARKAPAKKAPAGKAPAGKAPAAQSTAGKTPAKKAPARKAPAKKAAEKADDAKPAKRTRRSA